jgi:hypothetical protein
MTADLTPTTEPDFVAILSLAAAAFQDRRSDHPPAPEVVNALLQAEKATKQQRLTYPLESLLGNWRLYFTAPRNAHLQGGVATGKGFYIPQIAPAQISFTQVQTSDRVEITNQIQFGSLLFKLTGLARYLGKKNLLAFDFNQMQLCLFGRTVYGGGFRSGSKAAATDFYSQPIAKLPFFAFFLVTENFIAARGRGGGLALWVKVT